MYTGSTLTSNFTCIAVQNLAKEAGATGWKSKLRTISSDLAEIKAQLAMLEALSPQELLQNSLHRDVKQRIAAAANKTVTDVNTLLMGFQQMKLIQGWCARRAKNKLPLPTSQKQMEVLLVGMLLPLSSVLCYLYNKLHTLYCVDRGPS